MLDKIKKVNIDHLLWLALILALVGSLKHLAFVFASVDGDYPFGVLQAIAIDVGLFSLSYSLRIRKQRNQSTKAIWLGIAMFSLISIYGNLTYGFLSINGSLPDWLQVIKPYILAASLPVLVLYLAELVSNNRWLDKQLGDFDLTHTPKTSKNWQVLRKLVWERDGKRCVDCQVDLSSGKYECHHIIFESEGGEGKPENLVTLCGKCHEIYHENNTYELLVKARRAKQDKIKYRRDQVLILERQNLTQQEMADRLKVSLSTVKNDLKEMSKNGQNH